MKLLYLRSIVAVTLVSAAVHGSSAPQDGGPQLEEDSEFWNRYLLGSSLTVSPTKAPSASPNAPSAAPTTSPTEFPTRSPIGGPCDVAVNLSCVNANGLQCDQLHAPATACADGSRIRTLTFRYQNCLCPASFNFQPNPNDVGENICVDSALLVEDLVVVECRGSNGSIMSVSPPEVLPDGLFTVTNTRGGFLPNKVYCDILDGETGALLQTNIIDTSGLTSLNLEDKFGAMLLESCDELTCVETISYTIDIVNIGENCMTITQADFVFNGDNTDLLPLLPKTEIEICPEESTSLVLEANITVCTAGEFLAQAIVVANPPDNNAGVCEDDSQLSFVIREQATHPPSPHPTPFPTPFPTPAPSPMPTHFPTPFPTPAPSPAPSPRPTKSPSFTPTQEPTFTPTKSPKSPKTPKSKPPKGAKSIKTKRCTIELDTRCVVGGDSAQAGRPCDTPDLGIESCSERPTSLLMLFNGGGCEQSDNRRTMGMCKDTNGGPPVNEGDLAYIMVTDVKGDRITYFSDKVKVGDTFLIKNNNDERLEEEMLIVIYTPDQKKILQVVQFWSLCSLRSPLELKNRFGASQLVEFTNGPQGTVSCFVTFIFIVEISVPTSAATTQPIRLTSLKVMTNFAGTLDLTNEIKGRTIAPGSLPKVVTLETHEIDASSRTRYTLIYIVEGFGDVTGQKCTGSETLSFLAGNAPRPPPKAPKDPKDPKDPKGMMKRRRN